ncbi:MAG: ribonuclease P protein component [Chloroflexota bacterium]|nr:MAG: ribonuclease P protein component [Chloroflexota bacterium]
MQSRLRLRDTRDFERLRREGRVYHQRGLTLSVAPNELPHNRYGFITGKGLGKAVQRNRVRRLLRETVRELHPRLRSGHDIVLIARRPLVGQPFVVVKRIVSELLYQAGLVESDVLE